MAGALVSDSLFDQLLADRPSPKVSIYFPVHAPGTPHRTSVLTARKLLGEASSRAAAAGDDLADPLRDALDRITAELLSPPAGLAAFAAPGFISVQRLPYPVGEELAVGDRFRLVPLVPLLQPGSFHILALTRSGTRWFAADRWSIREGALPGAPDGIDDVLRHMDPEKQLQHHTTGDGRFGFHGHQEKDDHAAVERYVRAVLGALKEAHTAPIVVIGPDDLASHLQAIAGADTPIAHVAANPTGMDDREILARASSVAPTVGRRADTHVIVDLDDIARAATDGRVARLTVDSAGRPLDDVGVADLVDRAVHDTLAGGGEVFDDPSIDTPMAAELRY